MPDRIPLEPAEFWALVAKQRQVEALKADLRAHIMQAETEITKVGAAGQALYDELAVKYGFVGRDECRFDETALVLIFPDDGAR